MNIGIKFSVFAYDIILQELCVVQISIYCLSMKIFCIVKLRMLFSGCSCYSGQWREHKAWRGCEWWGGYPDTGAQKNTERRECNRGQTAAPHSPGRIHFVDTHNAIDMMNLLIDFIANLIAVNKWLFVMHNIPRGNLRIIYFIFCPSFFLCRSCLSHSKIWKPNIKKRQISVLKVISIKKTGQLRRSSCR